MPISCKPILVNNTPCNCVTAVTSAGLYGVASPLYPTTASLNALHTVQYDDRIVMYKRTATGWIEVQNYSLGSSDTDTRIEFNQVLPSGEWEWEIRDVIANTVLSTFTTPAIVANTVSSPNGTVDVNLNANDYELEVTHTTNPDGSITLNDGTIVPAPVILGAAWDSSAIPPADGDLVIVDNGYLVLPIPNEERICLNTGAPFLVADPNNPTIAEVEAWATVNLTLQQRENGTQLVYFVTGDGGSCDVPDYEWTLNKGSQLVTLSNKRVFNTKTVYVDAGSGSDVTGRRGYREFPFKTLDAGINAALESDLLYVFPGDYIQSTPITRWINIHCESGVDWLLQSNFSAATDFALAKTVNWKFDVLRQVSHDQYQCRPLNTLGGYNLVANKH
jgi:hypothetical protein